MKSRIIITQKEIQEVEEQYQKALVGFKFTFASIESINVSKLIASINRANSNSLLAKKKREDKRCEAYNLRAYNFKKEAIPRLNKIKENL